MKLRLLSTRHLTLIGSFLFPIMVLAGNADPAQIISNPLKASNFSEFLSLVLNAVINVGTPILVLMFVYIGFMFVMARGNAGKLTEARTALMYGVLGAFLILGAFVLEKVISATLEPFLRT